MQYCFTWTLFWEGNTLFFAEYCTSGTYKEFVEHKQCVTLNLLTFELISWKVLFVSKRFKYTSRIFHASIRTFKKNYIWLLTTLFITTIFAETYIKEFVLQQSIRFLAQSDIRGRSRNSATCDMRYFATAVHGCNICNGFVCLMWQGW